MNLYAGSTFRVQTDYVPNAMKEAADATDHHYEQEAMTECASMWMLATVTESEQRADRLRALLETMADLLSETRRQRVEIARDLGRDDPRVREAVARLAELERSLEEGGAEAVSVHKLLQHVT